MNGDKELNLPEDHDADVILRISKLEKSELVDKAVQVPFLPCP